LEKIRHKELAVAATIDEHPDEAKSVNPVPPLVPEVEDVDDFIQMEAVSEDPVALIVSLMDELDRALELPPAPGRFTWNSPISATTTPATTMMPARKKRRHFETGRAPRLGAEACGLCTS
jgi:hypothetical protein